MLYLKEFSDHRIVLSNSEEEHVLECEAPNMFIRDIVEDILESGRK